MLKETNRIWGRIWKQCKIWNYFYGVIFHFNEVNIVNNFINISFFYLHINANAFLSTYLLIWWFLHIKLRNLIIIKIQILLDNFKIFTVCDRHCSTHVFIQSSCCYYWISYSVPRSNLGDYNTASIFLCFI